MRFGLSVLCWRVVPYSPELLCLPFPPIPLTSFPVSLPAGPDLGWPQIRCQRPRPRCHSSPYCRPSLWIIIWVVLFGRDRLQGSAVTLARQTTESSGRGSGGTMGLSRLAQNLATQKIKLKVDIRWGAGLTLRRLSPSWLIPVSSFSIFTHADLRPTKLESALYLWKHIPACFV